MATLGNSRLGHISHKLTETQKRYRAWRMSAKYLIFLLSLETLTWTSAFYGDKVTERGHIDWTDLIVIITLMSGVVAANPKKYIKTGSICFAILTLILAWAAEFTGGPELNIVADSCLAIFFGFVAYMILYDIWTTQGVTSDTIIGSVCVYILIGATWAFFYSLVELLVPNSFQLTISGTAGNAGDLVHSRNYPLLMYYSFVTLCSLGYGDMLPISPAARMLSTAEAMVGQFYLAIFVARLISLYIPRRQQD